MLEIAYNPELIDPFDHRQLHPGKGYWFNPENGEKYYINNGIPVFLPEQQMGGNNLKYSRFYDRISRFYRVSSVIYSRLKGSTEKQIKKKYLDLLNIQSGEKVLEVAVGSADNFKYLPANAMYCGIDISYGMLTMARRHLRKWKIPAGLFQGEAEHLPFADNTFDVVFHVGGISLFNDNRKAVAEMIRVTNPGGRLMIVDDNEGNPGRSDHKNPFSPLPGQQNNSGPDYPVKMLPTGMKNIEIRYLFDEQLYCLTFTKPNVTKDAVQSNNINLRA